jgi:plastocyanin
VVATGATVAIAGVAGADESTTVYVSDVGGNCFTRVPGNPACGAKPTVTIQTGDTVTWDYNASGTTPHNRKGTSGPQQDTTWFESEEFKSSGTDAHTFFLPGEYDFLCEAHPGMVGTVNVTGEPVEPTPAPTESPSPSPTASATPRATVSPTPTPGMNDRVTPAPRGAARADSVPPAITSLKLTAQRRGAKVSFKLSESASVTLRVKRGKTTLKTVRGSFRAGGGSVTLRRMARGTYRVEIEARDARGNKAAVQRKTVKVKR